MIAAETQANAGTGTSVPKKRSETATGDKFRNYRLRKQQRALESAGLEATLHTHCRSCHARIKPSFIRPFCKGGRCRNDFAKSIKVPRVIPITGTDRRVAEYLLSGRPQEMLETIKLDNYE